MHARRARIAALAVIDVALFMISGIPAYRDATHGADLVIGQIAWFGFLLGLLALIVLGALAVGRHLNRKEKTP
jgi:hypothetical protein